MPHQIKFLVREKIVFLLYWVLNWKNFVLIACTTDFRALGEINQLNISLNSLFFTPKCLNYHDAKIVHRVNEPKLNIFTRITRDTLDKLLLGN